MNMKKVVTGSLAGIMAVSAMAVNTFADLTTGTTVNQEAKEKTWNLTESGWKIHYPTSFSGKITYGYNTDGGNAISQNIAAHKAKLEYLIEVYDADKNTGDREAPAIIDGDVKLMVTGKYTNQLGNVSTKTVTATATPVKVKNGLYKVTFWTTAYNDVLTGGNTITMNQFTYPSREGETLEFTYALSYNATGHEVYTSKKDATDALNDLNVFSRIANASSVVGGETTTGLTWWDGNTQNTVYDGTYGSGGSTPEPGNTYPTYEAAKSALASKVTDYDAAAASLKTMADNYASAKKNVESLKRSDAAAFTAAELEALKNFVNDGTIDYLDDTNSTPITDASLISALNKILPAGSVISGTSAPDDITGSGGATILASLTAANAASVLYLNSFAAFGTGGALNASYAYNETTPNTPPTGTLAVAADTAITARDLEYVNVALGAYADGFTGATMDTLTNKGIVWMDAGVVTTAKFPAVGTILDANGDYLSTGTLSDIKALISAVDAASKTKATLPNSTEVYRSLAKQIDTAMNGAQDIITGSAINSGSSLGRSLADLHVAGVGGNKQTELDKHDSTDKFDKTSDVTGSKWISLQSLTDDENAKIAILSYLYNTKGATLTFNFAYDDEGDESGRDADSFSDDSDKLTGSKNALKEMALRANETGVMTEAKEMKDWSVSFDWDEIMQNTFGYDVNNTGNIWKLEAKLNMKNSSLHDAIYDGNLYLKSVTVKVPEKTFTILAAGEGTSDSTEDVVAPESSDASSESSEAESSEASSVESSEPAPETPVTNPSTGNAPIALAVIPVAVAAAAVIIKKRG